MGYFSEIFELHPTDYPAQTTGFNTVHTLVRDPCLNPVTTQVRRGAAMNRSSSPEMSCRPTGSTAHDVSTKIPWALQHPYTSLLALNYEELNLN